MQVRALQSFVSPYGSPSVGDVFDVPVDVAVAWAKAGLVASVGEPRIEEAARQAPEVAVVRKGRRR